MMTCFIKALQKSSKTTGISLSPTIGLDVRPRSQLGSLGFGFMVFGQKIICLKTKISEEDFTWTALRSSRPDENLDQTFEDLFRVVSSENFLHRRGLGNELPFFISAHHASLQPQVDQLVPALANRLSNRGIPVLLLNLYDLTVEILKTRGHWDRLIEKESSIPRDRFLSTLQNVTNAKDQLVPLVAERLAAAPCRVLLLSGVGLVYPYMRSHSVLENLQSVTKQTPTVLFFPGDYSFVDGKGSYLKLFGILPDDRYYRAFNIADFRA